MFLIQTKIKIETFCDNFVFPKLNIKNIHWRAEKSWMPRLWKVDCKFIFKHFMREKSHIIVRCVKNVLVPRHYWINNSTRFMRKKDPLVAICFRIGVPSILSFFWNYWRSRLLFQSENLKNFDGVGICWMEFWQEKFNFLGRKNTEH